MEIAVKGKVNTKKTRFNNESRAIAHYNIQLKECYVEHNCK